MTGKAKLLRLMLVAIAGLGAWPTVAGAACGITGVNGQSFVTEVPTPLMRHGGTASGYTRLTLTFTAPGGGSDVDCRIAIRTPTGQLRSPTTSVAIPYVVSTLRTGGSIISYTAAPASFLPVVRTDTQLDLYIVISDATYPFGSYFDNSGVVVELYDGTTLKATAPFVSAPPNLHIFDYIQTACTIGTGADGGTRVLDFSDGSTISLAQKFAVFGDITCTGTADVSLSSANGGATNPVAANASFQAHFDYVATTTLNGVTVSIDTSDIGSTGGAETVTVTVPGMTNTPLSVGVTPKLPAKSLLAGSYADVLTIRIEAR